MTVALSESTITQVAALHMVAAAVKKAQELGSSISVAVVDCNGVLKAFSRMDSAIIISVRLAQQKAWSAAATRIPSHGLWELVKDDPPLLASLPHQEGMFAAGGGYPIVVGGQVIGGIGASGGYYTRDQMCAEAGLAALEEL